MAVTLHELLAPQFILDLVSRVRPGQGPLGKWLGFQPNTYSPENGGLSGPATMTGPSVQQGPLRTVTYRIFNATRVPANFRAPATGPGTITRNPMAAVTVVSCRCHDKIPLNYEELNNLSPMIGPNSAVDASGQDYIKRQSSYIATRFGKSVELMAAGMMRDSLYVIQVGDDWVPSFTPAVAPQTGFRIEFQIPAGNKNQLNMLGLGNIITIPWNNIAAPIISDLLAVDAAFGQLHGWSLTDVWINSTMWGHIINNTQVRNTAGTAATPFDSFDRDKEYGMDGLPTNKYVTILKGLPTVRWHLCNDVLSMGGNQIDISYEQSTATAQKLIPDNMAIFCTEPSPDHCKLYLSGEPVVENPGMPAVMRMGYHFWHEYVTQPSAIDLLGLFNGIPCLYNPLVFAPAVVIF